MLELTQPLLMGGLTAVRLFTPEDRVGSRIAISCALLRPNVSRGGQTLETTDSPAGDVLLCYMKFSKNK